MAKKRTNGEGNIRKRKNGRWEGRYTAGYDQSGKWFELYAKPNIRPSTAGYYQRAMEESTIPWIGHIKLAKLSSREIQKLYKDLLEDGRLREKQKKKHPGLSGSRYEVSTPCSMVPWTGWRKNICSSKAPQATVLS